MDVVLGVEAASDDQVSVGYQPAPGDVVGVGNPIEIWRTVRDHGAAGVEVVPVDVAHRLAVRDQPGGAAAGRPGRAIEDSLGGRAPLSPVPFLTVGVEKRRLTRDSADHGVRRVGDVDGEDHVVASGSRCGRRNEAMAQRIETLAREGRKHGALHAFPRVRRHAVPRSAVHGDVVAAFDQSGKQRGEEGLVSRVRGRNAARAVHADREAH